MAPDTVALLMPLIRGLILLTLLLLVGCAMARRLTLQHLADAGVEIRQRATLWLLILPRALATFLLALCLARSAAQLLMFMGPGEAIDPTFARAVLMGGVWGRSNVGQTALAAFLFAAFTLARTRPRAMHTLLLVAIPPLLWLQSGMGHATDERWPPLLGRLLHTGHLVGGGLWLGTLVVLAIAVIPALRGPLHLPRLARVISAFSLPARIGAALVIGSGVIASWQYGVSIGAALATPWGRYLVVKLLCFGGILLAGWWNWRRVTPALQQEQPGSDQRLRRAIGVELTLSAALLIATALLVGAEHPVPDVPIDLIEEGVE